MGCALSIPIFTLVGTYYGKCIYVLDHHTCIVKIQFKNKYIKLILYINNLNPLNIENKKLAYEDHVKSKLILEKIILNKKIKIDILDFCSEIARGNVYILKDNKEYDLIHLFNNYEAIHPNY